jgi:hypothetical protein
MAKSVPEVMTEETVVANSHCRQIMAENPAKQCAREMFHSKFFQSICSNRPLSPKLTI